VTGRANLACAVALALALVLNGCGLSPSTPRTAPSTPRTAPSTPRTVRTGATTHAARPSSTTATLIARADRTHEVPTPVPLPHPVGGWRTALQAVQVFATTYINWTATTVSARLQALSEVSVGQASSATSLAAAQTAHDSTLRRGGIANRGTVESVALAPGSTNRYVVVTEERTTAASSAAYDGLGPAWHVTLATVTRIRGGLWVLSAWQPES